MTQKSVRGVRLPSTTFGSNVFTGGHREQASRQRPFSNDDTIVRVIARSQQLRVVTE